MNIPWRVPDGATRRGRMPPAGRQIWHEDDRGRRHGTALRWYPDGQLRALVDYEGGRRHGRYRAWHPDGTLAVEGSYDHDREHGRWRSYDGQGELQMELPCVEGSTEGTCRSYYPGGVVARQWTARAGREEGPVTVYLTDGSRFSEASFRDGRRHGRREVWLAGVRILEDHWADGIAEGTMRTWGFSGQLLQEGTLHSGQRHGRWRFWGYTGELMAEGDYADGEVVGDWAPPEPTGITPPPLELPPVRRDLAQSGPVATTVITGFLGAGKTTVILDLLRQRPPGERWVVYVNEFGEVGVDAAALPADSEAGGLLVRELAGGCACCTSSGPFVEGIGQAIDTLSPDHLIVEPTGLADAGALITELRERLAGRLELRATLCIVDPRRLQDPRYIDNPAYLAQLRACEVAVANRCDLATGEDLDRFRALCAELPGLTGALETELGRVDLEWLTLAPRDQDNAEHGHHHAHDPSEGVAGRGFVFPAEARFVPAVLEEALRAALPVGWLRLKGVVNTPSGERLLLNADERDGVVCFDWRSASDQGASRIECIVAGREAIDWDALRAKIDQASSSSS
ncbi:MAG: G3E family GTPase/antitoxin component YwqK of YwqJK toxin-antitoxin module [Myxococcota bacterium]|jgi:G3E family GTPase/antitoxin component YwqK of YwqJK toxin-antitoxin module